MKFKENDTEQFVLLTLEEYEKLESIRKMKTDNHYGVKLKMIHMETINFLSAVMVLLKTKEVLEFSIIDDTVTLELITKDGMIKSSFSTQLCEMYYGRPMKFIEQVL